MDDLVGEPFIAAYLAPVLTAAYDELIGPGRWECSVRSVDIGETVVAAHATGKAGNVFLCHPFMVHTATWPHRGAGPRMIAQPAVNAPGGFALDGSDPSPVAQAIVKGLAIAD